MRQEVIGVLFLIMLVVPVVSAFSFENFWDQITGQASLEEDNLLAYYNFNGDAKDSQGNYDASVSGATLTDGVGGDAYYFDGNDFIKSNLNKLSMQNPASISFWFKTDKLVNGKAIHLENSYSSGNYATIRFYEDGNIRFYHRIGWTTYGSIYINKDYADGVWHNYVVTWDGSTTEVYYDGVSQKQASYSGSLNYNSLYIGGTWYRDYFKGSLDEIKVYDKVLSASEVQDVYNEFGSKGEVECVDDSDCPSKEGEPYCKGDQLCTSYTFYDCIEGVCVANAGAGACKDCPNGCVDGACVEEDIKCGDGICSDGENSCPDDCGWFQIKVIGDYGSKILAELQSFTYQGMDYSIDDVFGGYGYNDLPVVYPDKSGKFMYLNISFQNLDTGDTDNFFAIQSEEAFTLRNSGISLFVEDIPRVTALKEDYMNISIAGAGPEIVCTDSDGGLNYYEKGYLYDKNGNLVWTEDGKGDDVKIISETKAELEINGEWINVELNEVYDLNIGRVKIIEIDVIEQSVTIGYFQIPDGCSDEGKLFERICGEEGNPEYSWYSCPNGCYDGACLTEPVEDCTQGCVYDDKCLTYGMRVDGKYCGISGELESQKQKSASCDNDFECLSNDCSNGKCVDVSAEIGELQESAGFGRKILCRILSIVSFGSYDYNECVGGSLQEIEEPEYFEGGDDCYLFELASNKLNLGDSLTDIRSGALDETELPETLADGTYIAADGKEYGYAQKVQVAGDLVYKSFADKDYNDEIPALGIHIDKNDMILSYYLSWKKFPVSDSNGGELEDFEGTELNILGKSYTIITSYLPGGYLGGPSLEMMTGDAVLSVLRDEGASLRVNGVNYDLRASYISDTKCKLCVSINNAPEEICDAELEEGETIKLSNGVVIGVSQINYAAKSGSVDNVVVYLGAKKVKFQDQQTVKINGNDVNGLMASIDYELDSDSHKVTLGKIILRWQAKEEYFIADNNEVMLPGLDSIKFVSGGFNIPVEEEIHIKTNGGNENVMELTIPIKDGTATIPLLYGDGSTWKGVGIAEDKLLHTSGGDVLEWNESDGDYYFVVSWIDNYDSESYFLSVTDVYENSGINYSKIKNEITGREICNVKSGNDCKIGNIVLGTADADPDDEYVKLMIGDSRTSFNKIYSKEGAWFQLPLAENVEGRSDWDLQMIEEDKDEKLANGGIIRFTLGFKEGKVEVRQARSVWASDGATDNDPDLETFDGSDKYVDWVLSDLGTEVQMNKVPLTQYSAELVYHGGESYGLIFLCGEEGKI